ncbi:MAG: NAD(P)/FAD-dependent oxidoreductase [Tannerella sp.]|jgi:phytoene dehydrogenase-like protein|nr:NAD(P)/FAD-dependent oxidoreductase [Tannerella sp.]
MEKYDVVIIGSGLGGLQCGYILSKHGLKVCVLEKNDRTGGCIQTFRRGKCLFDTGFHYVGGLDDGQPLHRLFSYFGLMDLPWQRMDEDGFDEVVLRGRSYMFANGYERFAATLSEQFPHQRENLRRYAAFLRSVSDNIFGSFVKRSEDDVYGTSLFARSAYDYLTSTIDDPLLRNVLSGTSLKMELDPRTLPLYVFAQINSSFIQSAWRLRGGGSQIAASLVKSIEKNGGTVRRNACVTRLVEEHGRIVAAEIISPGNGNGSLGNGSGLHGNDNGLHGNDNGLHENDNDRHGSDNGLQGNDNSLPENGSGLRENGNGSPENGNGLLQPGALQKLGTERVEAGYFISGIHPAATLSLITESAIIRNIYRKRINNLPCTYGMFTANIALKENSVPYLNRNIYVYNTDDVWQYAVCKPENVNTCALVSFQPPADGSPYTRNVDILTPMYWPEIERWADTAVGRRGDDYLSYKRQKMEACLRLVSGHIPGLEDAGNVIEKAYTSTMLTYRDYTGTPFGSAYGIRKNCEQLMTTLLSPRTPEPNLFLTGQNLNLHGILGVSMTSFLTCAEIIGMDKATEGLL